METKKEDRRVMYTKMFLRESLLALMETKPVEKITTTELCRHAGINRNTFYTHYKSPEELLESIEEELLDSISSSMRGEISIESLLSIMKNNADLCRVLFSPYCPHMGCELTWNPVSQTFDCPCHGSRFGKDGELLCGPANLSQKPLT